MACHCLDLRRDSKVAKYLANNFISVIMAVIQLVIWTSALCVLKFQPVKGQIQESSAKLIALHFFILVGIGFTALLLVGLLKDKQTYIQAFLVFIIVVIVLLVLFIIINIFMQPERFGLSGFLASMLIIMVDIFTYFVVRNYYLALTSNGQNQNTSPNSA